MAELAAGRLGLAARDTAEHLFAIQRVVALIPRWMWRESAKEKLREFARAGRIVEERMPAHAGRPLGEVLAFDDEIPDLAADMLRPDPGERPRTGEILDHAFFRRVREARRR